MAEDSAAHFATLRVTFAKRGREGEGVYPVMLDVGERSCLVVGGGGVALRKVQGLVEEGARVTVVAPELVDPLRDLLAKAEIDWLQRPYRSGEAADYTLVFAATDDRALNRRIFNDAEGAGVWVNVADDPELCAFHLPGRVRRGPLQLAIGSAGQAPFVVRRLRQLLERRFGPEWGEWLDAAARFRSRVLESGLDRSHREAVFDRFFDATVDRERWSARVPTEAEQAGWLSPPGSPPEAPGRPPAAALTRPGDASGGFVTLVGAGPGCAGLLTVRGLQRLRDADAVVYDRLAAAALPCDLAPRVELHAVGKTAGNHPIPQGEINSLLVRLARRGMRVVRLKGGDPYVFGRGGEEAEVLAEEGIPFEVVSGVTSGVAALAWAGIPATHRREAVRLTLLTAHEAIKGDGPQVRWDLLANDRHATIVGYMGVTALPDVVERLLEAGMDPDTPAAMVEQGTTSAQRTAVATVATLPEAVNAAGLKPPALFAIGPTVRHADRLDWFGRLPLVGRRVLLTSAGGDLACDLERAGAEVVVVPLPVTPAARAVMAAMPISDCVLRDRSEVEWLDDERDNPGWGPELVAWCLGEDAANRAHDRGWREVKRLDDGVDCVRLVEKLANHVARRAG